MQKPESGSTTLSRPPLSDGEDGRRNRPREDRREHGRFVSAYGMHVISGPPGGPYRRLVLDRDWHPVGPLNEWYRLRAGVGAPSTRETYLRVLTPFFGFLLLNEWTWGPEPALVREFTRACMQSIGCVLRRDRERDGFSVAVTAQAPLSPGSLALFQAAARDLNEVLIEGEWHPQARAHRRYYAYANPMYSEMSRRWKRDAVAQKTRLLRKPRCGWSG